MDKEFEVLQRFYKGLLQKIQIEGKLREDSVLFTLIKITSNNRFRLLEDSSLNPGIIPKEILSSLLYKKLIRQTDKLNSFVITGKGIWEIEEKILGKEKFKELFDKEFFNFYKESDKPFSEKEKVVIFSMIAIRSFSKEASINLKKGDSLVENFRKIIEASYEQLKAVGAISGLDKSELYGEYNKTETAVSGLFRRVNELPKKTKNLYQFSGKYVYYLDLSEGLKINEEKLSFLLKQIFSSVKLTAQQAEEVYQFLCHVASKYSIYMFDTSGRVYSKPSFDETIKEVFYSSI